jgi:ABC-type transporter Mla MlaB component
MSTIQNSNGGGPTMDGHDPTEPVFDFTGVGRVDLGALALMLTALELLPEENRRVWVAGLPGSFWTSMRSMGLDGYFMQIPSRRGLKA